ncbi:ribosomal protein S5 domain 2-like protein [Hymenopellis radicata]|nr:ribosomal protein S5 domain 2-like protein [Hymenopellis radicata]
MTRPDGRSPHDIRPITAEFDDLARVDGSARFGFGSTPSALASFTGPIEVRLAAENPSRLSLDVVVRPLSGIPGTREKKTGSVLGSVLKQSLVMEANPRTAVVLVVQSLTDEGSLASMINASTMACMASASVPMRGVVCAVDVGMTDDDFIVDPSPEEKQHTSASGCFAFHIQGLQRVECIWTNWTGSGFDEQELLQARTIARESVINVWKTLKETVARREKLPLEAEDEMEI